MTCFMIEMSSINFLGFYNYPSVLKGGFQFKISRIRCETFEHFDVKRDSKTQRVQKLKIILNIILRKTGVQ